MALGTKVRRGNVHLKTALVGAATSAAKTKGAYLKDKYFRLKARRGGLRAAVAIGHKILVAAFHMLSKGVAYHDLGDDYLDNVDRARTAKNVSNASDSPSTSSRVANGELLLHNLVEIWASTDADNGACSRSSA